MTASAERERLLALGALHALRMHASKGLTWERASWRLFWDAARLSSRDLMRLSLSATAARRCCSSPAIWAAACLKAP